jgi:hypothetical protein
MRAMSPRASAIDLIVVSATTLAGVMAFGHLWPFVASFSAEGRIAVATSAQLLIGGAVPLFLMRARRESVESFGFVSKGTVSSLLVAGAMAALYDACVSVARTEVAWIPFGRHGVMRLALSLSVPSKPIAVAAVVLAWGILEGFFAMYFAVKAHAAIGAPGRAPWAGALAFGVFNAIVHAVLGQGVGSVASSFASGVLIPGVLVLTGNAWGGTLVQVLTNAVAAR